MLAEATGVQARDHPACNFYFFVFFLVFRGPGAVKQENTSRNTETNSKINFIFGARKIIFCTSNSRLTPPILLIFWPKNSKAVKTTNVGPLKETIPLTKKKAPYVGQTK